MTRRAALQINKGMESVIEFKLPALGENIEQGDLVRLMIAPGATVSEGQSVMELETDKAVVEVPSSVNGTVKEILVKEGDKIKVGRSFLPRTVMAPPAAEAKTTPRQEEPAKRATRLRRRKILPALLPPSLPLWLRQPRSRSRFAHRNQNLSRRRNEHDQPTPRRPASSVCRNWEKTFRRVIWCA